nr:T9SS type A sorting domain-containing protein [Bacteroidota bacterium]
GSIFHLPFPPPNGQWSKTIGNFQSGEGYYIKVNENATLTLSEPAESLSHHAKSQKRPGRGYFNPIWENNPFMPMHIIIQPVDLLIPGDEIGIFDADLCVGSGLYDGTVESLMISCSMNDPETSMKDGADSGNTYSVSLWKADQGILYEQIEYDLMLGDQAFGNLGTSVLGISSITQISGQVQARDTYLEVSPNPFINNITAKLRMPFDGTVQFEITNLTGQTIIKTNELNYQKGIHTISLSGVDMFSGTFLLRTFLRSNEEQFIFVKKLVKH